MISVAIYFGRDANGRPSFEIVEIHGDDPKPGTEFYAVPSDEDFKAGLAHIVRNKEQVLLHTAGPTERYVVEQTFAALAALLRIRP